MHNLSRGRAKVIITIRQDMKIQALTFYSYTHINNELHSHIIFNIYYSPITDKCKINTEHWQDKGVFTCGSIHWCAPPFIRT